MLIGDQTLGFHSDQHSTGSILIVPKFHFEPQQIENIVILRGFRRAHSSGCCTTVLSLLILEATVKFILKYKQLMYTRGDLACQNT